MKDRIKQLKIQTCKWASENASSTEYENAADQKFAELIVRECLLVTKKQYNDTLPWGGVEDTIKEHFGVEDV